MGRPGYRLAVAAVPMDSGKFRYKRAPCGLVIDAGQRKDSIARCLKDRSLLLLPSATVALEP